MNYEEVLQECIQCYQQEQFDKALVLAKQLQTLDTNGAEGYYIEAMILQQRYDWNGSLNALSGAIENAPYDANLYNLKAFALMNMGEYTHAEESLKEAIRLEDLEVAHRNYVILKILTDQGDDAVQYLVERLQAKPEDPENWMLMGDLMARANMNDKAQGYYDKAKELMSSSNT